MIKIATFTFNPFGENTYVVYDETGEAIVVDPGNYDAEESEALVAFIQDNKLKPVLIANTHAHVDHVLGVTHVKRQFGIPFALHIDEEPVLRSVKVYAPNYGFTAYEEPEVDHWIEVGEPLRFGNSSLKVLFVPGHAPGHLAFYDEVSQSLLAGDVLFRESIGRTDLPGGSHPVLMRSIIEEVFTLPEDVKVYPGHGPATTVGHERKYNPFFRG
jgi:hydroxyacylglutathione hydrolase